MCELRRVDAGTRLVGPRHAVGFGHSDVALEPFAATPCREMLSSRSLIGNMSTCFSLLGSLELAGSLKQTLDRTYSEPNAYDCAEREIERAGIQQDLERVTQIHLFLSAFLGCARRDFWPASRLQTADLSARPASLLS
jgi:hypothetical protein